MYVLFQYKFHPSWPVVHVPGGMSHSSMINWVDIEVPSRTLVLTELITVAGMANNSAMVLQRTTKSTFGVSNRVVVLATEL